MNKTQLLKRAKAFFKSFLEKILGTEFRSHRIPFGALRGRWIYMAPQISLRMWFGVDEPWIARLSRELIQPEDIIYDAGAHIGYTSLLFAQQLAGTGAVHAFEILPSTAELLRRTIEANRFENITIHEVGLGGEEAEYDLPVGPTAMTSIRGVVRSDQKSERGVVVRLDAYQREKGLPMPALIKMDIEGAEIDCLNGSRELIQACRPKMIIAFHSRDLLRRGYDLLTSLGYQLFDEQGMLTAERIDAIEGYFNESILCLSAADLNG